MTSVTLQPRRAAITPPPHSGTKPMLTVPVAPDVYTQAYNLLTEDGAPYPVKNLPLSRAVRTNQAVFGERWRIRRPDQSEVLVSGNAKPVLGSNGERVACVLTLNIVGPEAGPQAGEQ